MTNTTPGGSLPRLEQVLFPFLSKLLEEDQKYFLKQYVHKIVTDDDRTWLFRRGERIQHLFVVIKGVIEEYQQLPPKDPPLRRIVADTNHPLATSRILIGIYDLAYHNRHTTYVSALSETTLYRIDASGIDWLLARNPESVDLLAPFAVIERLRTMPLLWGIPRVTMGLLADEFSQWTYIPNDVIYEKNTPIDTLYLIDQGQVCLEWSGKPSRYLGNGAVFGLLDTEGLAVRRAHRAVAVKRTVLFRIPRSIFHRIAGFRPDERGDKAYADIEQAVRQVPIFAQLYKVERNQFNQLLGYFSHYYLPDPYALIQQGEVNHSLWILLPGDKGRAQVHALKIGSNDDTEGILQSNQAMRAATEQVIQKAYQSFGVEGLAYFGETALHTSTPMNATIEGEEGSQWLRLHRLDLKQAEYDLKTKDPNYNLKASLRFPPLSAPKLPHSPFAVSNWLQPGEVIQKFYPHHWLVLLHKLAPSILLLGALLILSLLVAFGRLNPNGWIYTVIVGGGLLMLIQTTWGLIDYLNDYLVITNQRVIQREEVLFFRRRQRDIPLERIENIDTHTGFWGSTLFKYGDITLHTAAKRGALQFSFIRKPKTVQKVIETLRDRRKIEETTRKRGTVQRLLAERLRLYLHLPERVCPSEEAASINPLQRLRNWIKALLIPAPQKKQKEVWRKHWLVLLVRLIPALGLPVIIVGFIGWQFFFLPSPLPRLLLALDILLLVIAILSFLWILWLIEDWRNDTYEVTDDTIIDVEKKPLFFEEKRRSASLEQIQNIDVNVPSFIHYFFDFGYVRLQTASSDGDFTFDLVPHPHKVAAEIQRRMEAAKEKKRQEAIKELPDWFDIYDLLGGIAKRRSRPPLA